MQKMMVNETELAERWHLSPKTLQRWRSEGRGPRFMKMSKRVVYPMDEVLDFESQSPRALTWESASDVVRPIGSNLIGPREIAHVTGLPLSIFSHEQTWDSLGVPHRRVQKLIRFDRDEVMAWAKRWLQQAEDPGIDAKADPAGRYRSLQQALASLPAGSPTDNAFALKWQCKRITIGIDHPSRGTAMPATLQVESTLTDRYQTTVPETVRRALRLGKRDKIHYTIRPNGEVVLTRAAAGEGNDPALAPFLGFLARDLAEHPERLQAVDASLVQRIQSLVGSVEVDLDAPLSADDE